MIFKTPEENLQDLLDHIYFATQEQIEMFFSNEIAPLMMDDIIRDKLRKRLLIRQTQYDEYEVISAQRPVGMSKTGVRQFLDAFWVVANMGANRVKYVAIDTHPIKFILQTEPDYDEDGNIIDEGGLYDIVVCETALDAEFGASVWAAKPGEDNVNHIALCYSEEAGERMKKRLKGYGYDYYCVLDPVTHRADYFDVEG